MLRGRRLPVRLRRLAIFAAAVGQSSAAEQYGLQGSVAFPAPQDGDGSFTETVPYVNCRGHNAEGCVDCGGHYAETCEVCPQGYGDLWCHGDCEWAFGGCSNSEGLMSRLRRRLYWMLPLSMASLCILTCYAAIYQKQVVSEYPQRIPDRGRESLGWRERRFGWGVFAMFSDLPTAMWALCCTPVLAAKNYHVGNVLGFWPSCCLITCTMYTPLHCIGAIIRTMLSRALKRNLGYYESNCCTDFALSLCCFPCEVGRESLEVDEAEGVQVRCLFDVGFVGHSPWVDEPSNRMATHEREGRHKVFEQQHLY